MPHDITEILTRLAPGKFDATRAANFDIERAKGHLESALPITRLLDPNDESLTCDFAFATDQPIEHYFGMLSLDVSKKAANLERVEQGVCPFLVNHDRNDQVGVVVPGTVELGPVIRGKVKFSQSARGKEMYQDVKDGIRNGTSIGFMIEDLKLENEKEARKGAIPMYRATKWTMLENSLASIPADIAVGAGRSFEKTQVLDPETLEREEIMPSETEIAAAKEAEQQRTSALAEARRKEVVAFADLYGKGEMAREALLESPNLTVDDMRELVKAERAKEKQEMPPPEDPKAKANRENPGAIQLARSMPRYGKLKAFTGEGAEERAFKFGQFILGGPLGQAKAREFCSTHGISVERAQSEGINEKGGYLVPEDFGNDMIDNVEKYGVFRPAAKIRPMSRDTASDPRIVGELDAYFVGESVAGTESDFEVDRVSLTAKKLMTLVVYSSEVSEDAVINMGDEIAMLSARAFAKKEDTCGFVGDGSSTHGGIRGITTKLKALSGTIANIAGLQVGTGNAYSELVLADFQGVVARLPEYADQNAAWYVHRTFYWNVMVKALLAGGGVTATEIENARNQLFLGYPVRFSQVMPKAEANSQVCAVFGDVAMGATLGDRRQYTVALSEHARFTADDIVFKATTRLDINVHSVGNAASSAADQVPGPIVGLITAAS